MLEISQNADCNQICQCWKCLIAIRFDIVPPRTSYYLSAFLDSMGTIVGRRCSRLHHGRSSAAIDRGGGIDAIEDGLASWYVAHAAVPFARGSLAEAKTSSSGVHQDPSCRHMHGCTFRKRPCVHPYTCMHIQRAYIQTYVRRDASELVQ